MTPPLISVVMLHHENKNQAYLDMALNSLGKSKDVTFECVLVLSAENGVKIPDDAPWIKPVWVPRETTGMQAENIGYKNAHPESKYFLHANDDLVFNQHALAEMVMVAGDQPVLVNPMSNCDNGMYYFTDLCYPQRKVEEMYLHSQELVEKERGPRIFLPQRQLPMYATLVPRKVREQVGEIDESFKRGWADTDFCLRAAKQGVMMGIAMSAYIHHFGGITSSGTSTDEDRIQDKMTFKEKWGEDVARSFGAIQ